MNLLCCKAFGFFFFQQRFCQSVIGVVQPCSGSSLQPLRLLPPPTPPPPPPPPAQQSSRRAAGGVAAGQDVAAPCSSPPSQGRGQVSRGSCRLHVFGSPTAPFVRAVSHGGISRQGAAWAGGQHPFMGTASSGWQ